MVYIKKIEITEFGKFSGYVLEFDAGFNEFIFPNEFGKSTIVDFLVFMLYGFKKTTAKKLGIEQNLLEKYMPWTGEGKISGMLTLDKDGTLYTIERRQLQSGRMSVTVRDETGAEQTFEKSPGEEFFAVDEQTFLKTFLVRQTDMVFERTDGIVTALNNLVTTGDDSVSFDKALKELRTKKNKYQQGDIRKGRIFDIPKDITGLEQKKFTLRREADALKERISQAGKLKERLHSIKKDEEKARALLEDARFSDGVRVCNQIMQIDAQINAIKSGDTEVVQFSPTVAANISEDFSKKRMLLQKLNESESELQRLESVIQSKKQGCAYFDLIKEHEAEVQGILNTPPKTNGVFLIIGLALLIAGAVAGYFFLPTLAVCAVGAIMTVLAFVIKTKPKIPQHIGLSKPELEAALQNFRSVKGEIELCGVMLEKEKSSSDSAKSQLDEVERRLESYKEDYGIDSPEALIVMQTRAADAKATYERIELLERSKSQILAGRSQDEFTGFANMSVKTEVTAKQAEESLSQLLLEKSALLSQAAEYERLETKHIELLTSISECETEISDLKAELDEANYQNDVLALAIEALSEAHDEINRVYSPIITQKASIPLQEFTDGKYESVYLDKDFKIRVKSEGGLHELGYFSKGTADAVYFAVRHAVNDIISGREGLPVIMDDPFWSLDSKRLENARSFMEKLAKQKQVIIFGAR